ncbi:hypothetical protein MIT9_P2584 [Methylomarinovum caldicuralii]|uniref:HDOD domain-containing protein n=1 Tax=Methylomarinovum caldicuralii TaxID=438856 RepID=A0AAU9C5G1_9GAMM|nr:HDOD domain-containing protein [Methylomarinovum caldicuralii]BCX82993.1 hypothetical protein MIT9_P2584 [Methylomarinovum caldicuralii]
MQVVNAQQFLDRLKEEIEKDSITLPTLPEVALKVRAAVEDGNTTASRLADLIAEDAALSARLLQVANSPLYRARTEITNLQIAITRLGYDTVRTLITALAMKQLFQPDSALLERYFRDIWRTSVEVAAISRALATLTPHLNAEQALLAGLIHQIGKLPILVLANCNREPAKDQAALDQLLDELHPTIGALILSHWNFPETLRRVVSEYRQWDRQTADGEADYVDIIQVAYLEHLADQGKEPPVDTTAIGAFSRLGLTPDIEVVEIEGIDATRQIFA